MDGLSRWDVLLLLLATYVAITTLVGLMVARRNQLVSQVQQQLEEVRQRAKKARQMKEIEEQSSQSAA